MIFDTEEKLSKRDLSKLNNNFKNNNLYELEWIKLLTGYLDIKFKNRIIKQPNNYCDIGIRENLKTDITLKKLDTYIFSENSSEYFLNNRNNSSLFCSLFNELALFFIAKFRETHIEAFVHLYRIIEKMSIMFPLLYFKQSTDFKHVYDDVKKLITNDTRGLKFYKNFQDTIFENAVELDVTVNFNFANLTADEQNDLQIIFANTIHNAINEASFSDNTIVIPFKRIIDFAITIRNRYFHLLIEHENDIEPLNLDMNEFFKCINDNVLNWIGVMYYKMFEILNK